MKNTLIYLYGTNGVLLVSNGMFNIIDISIEFNRVSMVCHEVLEEDEVAIRIPIVTIDFISAKKIYANIMNLGTIQRVSVVENSSVILDVDTIYPVASNVISKDGTYVNLINFVINKNFLFNEGVE